MVRLISVVINGLTVVSGTDTIRALVDAAVEGFVEEASGVLLVAVVLSAIARIYSSSKKYKNSVNFHSLFAAVLFVPVISLSVLFV